MIKDLILLITMLLILKKKKQIRLEYYIQAPPDYKQLTFNTRPCITKLLFKFISYIYLFHL